MTLPNRIASKIAPANPNGCWEWTAHVNKAGYGRVLWQRRTAMAHRVVYELLVGPIPAGLSIDHLCRNRACVNPAHLEPVTTRENNLRGIGHAAQHAAKTQCPQGHPYDEANTRWFAGSRYCRTCHRDAERARYHERRRAS